MFTLRCTRALLKRLKVEPDQSLPNSTTRLGDWYAHIFNLRPKHLVLCVSERTILPIVLVASDPVPLAIRLAAAVPPVLHELGVPGPLIMAEAAAMQEVSFGTTANRTVVGYINDFGRALEFFDALSPAEMAQKLIKTPCRTMSWASPKKATIELFSS